jgi:hypothetical protein
MRGDKAEPSLARDFKANYTKKSAVEQMNP